MFVGHALVAFALAASAARVRDWPADRAVAVGVVAGLFATLPDVDMAYALLGLAGGAEGVGAASDAFWAAAHVVHRGVTHSLVVGGVAAVAFAAWRARSPDGAPGRLRLVAAGLAAGSLAWVWTTGGALAAGILALFLVAGFVIVALAARWGFGARTVGLAAGLGLATHPFGDLLTGAPPALAYPLDATLVAGRVTLHPDPTVHLLGAFFVELATVWAALAVLARLRGWRLRGAVRPRALLGVGYAAAVALVPAPTLAAASPFVVSVLAVGALGVPLGRGRTTRLAAVTTALTAVTLAAGAYLLVYLLP